MVNYSSFLLPRVLELVYTAWDMQPLAQDCGYTGLPFRWYAERRFLLRCELDAAFFHLYGISRDDAAYILDTFPIVRRKNEKKHGEYRTKRVILEIYDACDGGSEPQWSAVLAVSSRCPQGGLTVALGGLARWRDAPLLRSYASGIMRHR